MAFSLRNLARRRRATAVTVSGLFAAALLGDTLGPLLLPALGKSQAGMILAACVAGGGLLYLSLLAVHCALALLLGRVFCSWLCPLGALQDLAGRVFARINGKKARWRYSPGGLSRYALPALFLGSLFWTGAWLYGLAEPYSVFARAVQSMGQPLYALGVNGMAALGDLSGFFQIPRVPYAPDLTGLILAAPPLMLALALVPRGRGYCNGVCPVGALLGAVAASAWLRPRFTERCDSCGLCERRCKARCLDSANKSVDAARCVACYNCLEACPRSALSLTPRPTPYLPGRAFVLRGLAAGAGVLLLAPVNRAYSIPPPSAPAPLLPAAPPRPAMPVLPPGALSLSHLESRCTGCRSCLDICPPGVLRVSGRAAWAEKGIARMILPGMDFFRAFCQIGCTRCSEVCPSGALLPVSLEEKKRLQLGQAVFTKALCVVVTEENRCGACAEHCPTGALRMTPPADGGLDLPHIEQNLCIGCGACQFACPVRPRQAVEVFALAVHAKADAPEPAGAQKDVEAGGEFPF